MAKYEDASVNEDVMVVMLNNRICENKDDERRGWSKAE